MSAVNYLLLVHEVKKTHDISDVWIFRNIVEFPSADSSCLSVLQYELLLTANCFLYSLDLAVSPINTLRMSLVVVLQ